MPSQLLCTAGPHGNYSVWDFEVFGNAEIALGRTSTASGFQATSSNDMQAFAAFDGNVNTRWSAGGGGTQWLRVDLGASTRLSRVNLNWEAAYGSTYKVQLSDDASTWRDAYSTSTGDGGTDELLLTPGTNTTGRYMRIWITGGPHGNYSLWDVQVFAG